MRRDGTRNPNTPYTHDRSDLRSPHRSGPSGQLEDHARTVHARWISSEPLIHPRLIFETNLRMTLYPPAEVELIDITSGRPVRRNVLLLFTTRQGNPFTDRTWSREGIKWRDATGW